MANKYTEAQKQASQRYIENNAQIRLVVSKEQKERYKMLADAEGKSLTRYIVDILENV